MNPKFVAITKKVISVVVGIGAGKIVAGVIEKNVDTDTLASKVSVTTASYALGYAVSEYASDFTDRKIDDAVEWIEKTLANRSQ